MNLRDEDLKQLIRDDPVPALSKQFPDRALARVTKPTKAAARQFEWNFTALGGALGQRPATAWRPWAWMLLAVALAWWAQTQVLQPTVEDELYKIDALGLSSLLTL
ncbi:MAG: hypothetical protein QM527_09345 [Alphaproteobacteria bacterium]|nr:hypothetical protein [Alphaproteobacteria bacterium]